MNNSLLQRFNNYEKIFVFFLLTNLIFILVNEEINLIPFEISGYFFWLSLGLYLGFRLSKREVDRAMEKQSFIGKKDDDILSKN